MWTARRRRLAGRSAELFMPSTARLCAASHGCWHKCGGCECRSHCFSYESVAVFTARSSRGNSACFQSLVGLPCRAPLHIEGVSGAASLGAPKAINALPKRQQLAKPPRLPSKVAPSQHDRGGLLCGSAYILLIDLSLLCTARSYAVSDGPHAWVQIAHYKCSVTPFLTETLDPSERRIQAAFSSC